MLKNNQKMILNQNGQTKVHMILYLDMDGVLTNFEERFADKFGYPAMAVRARKHFSTEWPQFIADKEFESLNWHPGGKELIEFVIDHPAFTTIEILSSSGGHDHHEEVSRQKSVWLAKQNITFKQNIVPGRKYKSDYARPNTILIDDTKSIVDSFVAAGGIGIHHVDLGDTILQLNSILARPLNT